MKYRIVDANYGPINSLVTLEELQGMGAVTINGSEIRDSAGVVATVPEYCTQNEGDCETCDLAIFGRDCVGNWVTWAIRA